MILCNINMRLGTELPDHWVRSCVPRSYDWFTEGFDTRDLIEARLAEL